MRRTWWLLTAWLLGCAIPATGEEVRWASSFDHALEQAGAEQKYVMVDFFTSWCGWCKVLDAKTYRDGRVVSRTDGMVSVKVDAEAQTDLARRYGVRAYPTIVFLNPDGSMRRRIQGYKGPEDFVPILDEVLSTEAEVYALERQVSGSFDDPQSRLDLARVLARAGNFDRAVAQFDTVLAMKNLPEDRRVEAELDLWIQLVRQEQKPKDARKGLEKWLKKRKNHPRRTEAQFFLARAREIEGKTKDARKCYEEISRTRPGSWFAERAKERLQALS